MRKMEGVTWLLNRMPFMNTYVDNVTEKTGYQPY